LLQDNEREDLGGISAFGDEIYDSVLKPMLSDPEWGPEEITAFKDALTVRWRPVYGSI
jgi:hypothetical protein